MKKGIKKRKLFLPLAAGLMLLCAWALQQAPPAELPAYAQKKITKTIEAVWPAQGVTRKPIAPAGRPVQLSRLMQGETLVGYLCVAEANSQYESFTYMVIYLPDLSIKRVEVLIYREPYGQEIGGRRWLQQFEGKKEGAGMEYGKDIDGLSGATISARSITENLRQLTTRMGEWKKQGLL